MKKFILTAAAAIITCALALTACNLNQNQQNTAESSETQTTTATEAPTQGKEEITLNSMSLEQKAAQTIVAGLANTYVDEDFKALADKGLGGAILFSANIADSEQLITLTNEIRSASGEIPILIAMDEEGGRVTRLPDDVLSMPSAYSIASSGDTEYCYKAGVNLGRQLKSFGLSTGFSPVMDIWSNPDNTVIGDRAFGTTVEEVCTYGIAELEGIMSTGEIAVAKHFPGHGDTDLDSHYGLPVVTKSLEELKKMEFLPFESAIDKGIQGIMVAHILCEKIDPDEPASLSKTVVTDILKGELGFEGVVFTDDLTMGAISEKYTPAEAAVKALNAGCDMLLVCFEYENANETINAIVNAVKNGELSEQRLDDAVLNILQMKNNAGLNNDILSLPDIDEMNELTSEFWE